jgi:hypothetical protein
MASYDDMISDAQGIMYLNKYEGADNGKQAAFKLWNFGLKAAPKAGVTVAHSWTRQVTYDEKAKKEAVAEKNASKVGFKHDDMKWDVAAASDKWSVKLSGPLVKDDWKVDGSLMFEEKPNKSRKIEATAGIESPDMSGTTTVLNMSVEQVMNMKDKKWAQDLPTIKADVNVNFEKDFNLGFAVEHDTKELQGADFAFVKTDEGNKYWGGYDHCNKFAKMGCLVKYAEKNFIHAYEARYSMEKDAPGMFGQPITVGAGGKYVLSKETTMGYSFEFAAEPHAQAKFEHKLDKNWKVAAHQSYDCKAAENKPAYKLGFDVAYTL